MKHQKNTLFKMKLLILLFFLPTLNALGLSRCDDPMDSGPCEAAITRYYYNQGTGRCEPFTFGGCGGNANNFGSHDECNSQCGVCGPVCLIFCEHGNRRDDRGCPLCSCNPAPTCDGMTCAENEVCIMDAPDCNCPPGAQCDCPEVQPRCVHLPGRCPLPGCIRGCPFYYDYDVNGCQTCNCVNQRPTCPTCTCPSGYEQSIEGTDINGCPKCSCNPLPPPPPTCEGMTCAFDEVCIMEAPDCNCPPGAQCDCPEVQPRCVHLPGRCPLPHCIRSCPFYEYDSNGCHTCTCLSQRPPCPTCSCPSGYVQSIEGTDINGCPKCSCNPATPSTCKDLQCGYNEMCVEKASGPVCVNAECTRLRGDLVRLAVCSNGCNNHSDCSGNMICCSLDACSTQCMEPAPVCPVFRCLPCPRDRPFMAYDTDGCQTCRCVSAQPVCPQCICPIGFEPRSQNNCDRCECQRITDQILPIDSCQNPACGPGERCEARALLCSAQPCPAPFAVCVNSSTGVPNPKAGSCPAVPPGLGGYCVQECSSDYDCVGDRKCCSNGCGMTCVMPTSNPIQPPATPSPPLNCGPGERFDVVSPPCSSEPCGAPLPVCVNIFTGIPNPKAGSCPMVTPGMGGICIQECSSDYDCPTWDHKCCSNGCGMTCVMPTNNQIQPPATPSPPLNCGPGERFDVVSPPCSSEPCGAPLPVCVNIFTGIPNPKAGSCPMVTPGMGGICVHECSSDYDCPTWDHKCCSNGCGMTCVAPTSNPIPPRRTASSCSRLSCRVDEECKMVETICPPGSDYFTCQGEPTAQCFSKFIACPEWGCPNQCPNGYVVDSTGCKSQSCTCAPPELPTCDTHSCGQGEHCEMHYMSLCPQDAPCHKSPTCVRDGSSNLRCELDQGVTDVIPVVYYLPREGCPSGSKLTYKSDDGTELCCRTRAVYSDKPACQYGQPQFSSQLTNNHQCGTNPIGPVDNAQGIFRLIFNIRRSCGSGKICTRHADGDWSVCCDAPPVRIQPFRFNAA